MMSDVERAGLMVQLIDEVKRGHGRLLSAQQQFVVAGEPDGLAQLVMTAVVRSAQPPTVPQIGRSLGYPRQTIQRQADVLAGLGLIEFIENPDHKRARRLVPTTAAREMHVRSNARAETWAAAFTSQMDPAELATTVKTLRAIREHLEHDARKPNNKSGSK